MTQDLFKKMMYLDSSEDYDMEEIEMIKQEAKNIDPAFNQVYRGLELKRAL